MTDHSFSFLFSNLDITRSDEDSTQIGIIAGSVGGSVVLIAFLLALVICVMVVCKHDIRWYQTKKTADIVKQKVDQYKWKIISEGVRTMNELLYYFPRQLL